MNNKNRLLIIPPHLFIGLIGLIVCCLLIRYPITVSEIKVLFNMDIICSFFIKLSIYNIFPAPRLLKATKLRSSRHRSRPAAERIQFIEIYEDKLLPLGQEERGIDIKGAAISAPSAFKLVY